MKGEAEAVRIPTPLPNERKVLWRERVVAHDGGCIGWWIE